MPTKTKPQNKELIQLRKNKYPLLNVGYTMLSMQ